MYTPDQLAEDAVQARVEGRDDAYTKLCVELCEMVSPEEAVRLIQQHQPQPTSPGANWREETGRAPMPV